MVSQAGWRVERATVTRGPGGVPEPVFRVTWKGYWQADCATTSEVARHVDLSTLVPVGWAGARSASRPSVAQPRPPGVAASRAVPAGPSGPDRGRPPAVVLRLLRGGDEGVVPRPAP